MSRCINFCFRHSAQFQPLIFCNKKGSNPPKIFFVTISPNKKTPAINFSLKISQSQAFYTYCTKILEKILQTGVHIHLTLKNIYGDDFLFPKRLMPASGSVKPFAGIISFWSHKAGGEEGIRTLVGLLPNGFQDRLVMTTSIPLHI